MNDCAESKDICATRVTGTEKSESSNENEVPEDHQKCVSQMYSSSSDEEALDCEAGPRTETPWHLTDGHGNSTEPTGGHVWSIRGHRWEKLFRNPSMAIGGPLVENPWPPVQIDNFRSDNLVCGTFRCRKKWKEIHAILLEILL